VRKTPEPLPLIPREPRDEASGVTSLRSNYSNRLQGLLKLVRPRLAISHHLEFKDCFGAVAGYVNGKIFVSCGNFGLALRLPSETLTQLFREADVSALKYFAKGHVKREYAVIPERIIGNRSRFKKLVDKSIKFALGARR
jgi:TfoX-like protein